MSNLFQTVAAGAYNLKNYYQGPIKDQFNNDVPIYRGAEKGKFSWSGAQVNRPLKVRRNQGIGAVADNGNLPSIGRQTGVQAVIAAKYNYLRFGITGPMIKHSQSDKGSFVRQAAHELEKGYEDLKSDCNRQCSWDGTGDLALMNASVTGATSVVIKGRESTEPALKFIDIGMTVDIYSGTTLVASGIGITGITSGTPTGSTATVTLDTAISASSGDILVRSGSGTSNEVQGLLTQLDGGTSTVFSVDRSSYIQTQGNQLSLSSGQLTIDALQQLDNLRRSRGGAKLGAVFSDFDSQRYYQKLLTIDKRYTNTVKGDGGFGSASEMYLEWNGVQWVPDKDCPTRIFMLPAEGIEKYVLAEMEFADETGAMLIAQTGVDAFEVRVRHFFNLFNAHAAGSGVLTSYVSP